MLMESKKGSTRQLPGFTLIELLVVIAIIGLLSGIAVINMSSTQARARDVIKINDLKRIEKALQLYEADYGTKPQVGGDVLWDGMAPYNLVNFLSEYFPEEEGVPVPENNGEDSIFVYCRDRTNPDKYLLATVLESNVDIPGDLDGTSQGLYDFTGDVEECLSSSNTHLGQVTPAPLGTIDCDDQNGGRINQDAGTDFINRTVFCLGYIN